tara:strand:- start:1622 stop:2137 length:516 start_codon:yes stop_codon:yes gene_type:complete
MPLIQDALGGYGQFAPTPRPTYQTSTLIPSGQQQVNVSTQISQYTSKEQVLAAVSDGTLDPETAVSILVKQMGFDESTAVNAVFNATSTGEDLNEFVEGANQGIGSGLDSAFEAGGTPLVSQTIVEPEIDISVENEEEENEIVKIKRISDNDRFKILGISILILAWIKLKK